MEAEVKEKGEYLGKCNRSACLAIPATHYNYSTQKYYCAACASIINDMNRRDALRMFGHDLCLPGPINSEPQK